MNKDQRSVEFVIDEVMSSVKCWGAVSAHDIEILRGKWREALLTERKEANKVRGVKELLEVQLSESQKRVEELEIVRSALLLGNAGSRERIESLERQLEEAKKDDDMHQEVLGERINSLIEQKKELEHQVRVKDEALRHLAGMPISDDSDDPKEIEKHEVYLPTKMPSWIVIQARNALTPSSSQTEEKK